MQKEVAVVGGGDGKSKMSKLSLSMKMMGRQSPIFKCMFNNFIYCV